MNEQFKVALGALLHDIGRFWQKAGRPGTHYEASADFIDEFQNLFPHDWIEDLRDAVGNHHKPVHKEMKEIEKIVKVADWLASEEEQKELGLKQLDADKTSLMPIASLIELHTKVNLTNKRFKLKPLSLDPTIDPTTFFPADDVEVSQEEYSKLWKDFESELRKLRIVNSHTRFISFLHVLRKFTSYMPSATPWEKEEDEEYPTFPNIPLYDHLKVTASIAVCLNALPSDHLDAMLDREESNLTQPIALMIRGDISGIQKFIYRITKPEAKEARGTAKRLRGRSFYLSTLSDVIADWFVRELDLTIANILFCAGGRFDLLIPIDDATQKKFRELEGKLQAWLLNEFYGEIGIQIADENVLLKDFHDMSRVYNALDDKLSDKKQRKFELLLSNKDFFATKELHDVCDACQITPLDDSDHKICSDCEEHREIGSKLPKTDFIAYTYGEVKDIFTKDGVFIDFTDPFNVVVAFLDQSEMEERTKKVKDRNGEVILYKLNSTDFILSGLPPNVDSAFRFLGNEAPVAQDDIDPIKRGKDSIGKGEVLDFEEIAFLSTGAQLLGVLKMDIDFLGLIFGKGIEPLSISSFATLSSCFDLFFTGWLNEICKDVSVNWKENLPENDPRHHIAVKIDNIFYIIYSGGDDLLIIGPYDQIIDLAQKIYEDFRTYTCENDNVTISAGILIVKPHFPIQRFTQLVDEELDKSKTPSVKKGEEFEKNKITLFGETVKWKDGAKGFDELIKFAKALSNQVEDKENPIPKSFVYFLDQLYKQHFTEDDISPLWIPKFHYTLARRVKKEVINSSELDLLFNVPLMMEYIHIPVSYVSLKTRKE